MSESEVSAACMKSSPDGLESATLIMESLETLIPSEKPNVP
jgi:hypothetical protein